MFLKACTSVEIAPTEASIMLKDSRTKSFRLSLSILITLEQLEKYFLCYSYSTVLRLRS